VRYNLSCVESAVKHQSTNWMPVFGKFEMVEKIVVFFSVVFEPPSIVYGIC